MVRVLAVPMLALIALGACIPASARAADPQESGFLVVDPSRGDLTTTIDIATSDVCTRGQMFAVKIDGPNLDGKDRGNLIGTTKISTIGPESYPGHYVVPLPTDLATYLATAAPGQRIKGAYVLTFACRDTLSTADLQVFTATLNINAKGRYDVRGDSATRIDALIEGYVPGSAGFAYGDPLSPDLEEAVPLAAGSAAAAEGSFGWRAGLVVAGALLLLAAFYAWWRGRVAQGQVESSDRDESTRVAN